MAIVIDFKARIVEAYNENEKLTIEARNHSIELGSDEHLDIIAKFKPILQKCKNGLIDINDLMEEYFPRDNKIQARELKDALHMLHSSLTIFLDNISTLDFNVIALESDRERIIEETHQVEEYINDINSFVLSGNDDILNELLG